jgi:hypothetical protein
MMSTPVRIPVSKRTYILLAKASNYAGYDSFMHTESEVKSGVFGGDRPNNLANQEGTSGL